MSLKSMPPLPRQHQEHPEKQKLVRGEITKGTWERKTYAAKRFKPEAKA